MVTVILFILILSVLVFVHELGHFIFAKLSGMKVDEFGIGFPPRIFSWGKGETKYSINLLLFGGFVKIHGEDQSAPIPGDHSSRSFGARPRYLQALVLIAGVLFNVLFAWMITSAGFMYGLPVSADFNDKYELRDVQVVITQVLPNSPAEKAGLIPGDEITFLETNKDAIYPKKVSDVQEFIAHNGFQPIVMHFTRVTTASSTTVLPAAGIVTNTPAIGVGLDAIGFLSLPIHLAIFNAGRLTISSFWGTAASLGTFVYHAFTQKNTLSQVSGPVGIAHLVGDARRLGIPYLISFISFISINLAVINLVPFPALDGGRLLFVIIESIFRRPIPAKVSQYLNTAGFFLLLLLMVVVTYNDIVRLFVK